MLASPIINPVVILSTYHAFYKTNPDIFWMRLVLGIVVSLVIGIIMGILFGKKDIITNNEDECGCSHCHENDECECEEHKHKNYFLSIVNHTALDLFEVVKYLMFGALIASIIQVSLPRDILVMFNNNRILSIITLMLFAYLVSLCSTSDSFVGKSLLSSFSKSSIMAYLLLGPMIDIKNTIVLFVNYKKSFVFSLISLIFICIFIVSMVIEL